MKNSELKIDMSAIGDMFSVVGDMFHRGDTDLSESLKMWGEISRKEKVKKRNEIIDNILDDEERT